MRLSFLPFIVKATVAALRKFPQFNGMLDTQTGEIIHHGDIHIGIASATPQGLLVPVIRYADQRSITQIGLEIKTLGRGHQGGSGLPPGPQWFDLYGDVPWKARRVDGDTYH